MKNVGIGWACFLEVIAMAVTGVKLSDSAIFQSDAISIALGVA
jgi:hypothetical protein